RAVILEDLQRRYGLPTEGTAPWDTKDGKVAVLAALADHGITPETVEWPRTPAWENREEKKAEALARAAKERDKADGWRKELAAGGVWKDDRLKPLTARQVEARERWIPRPTLRPRKSRPTRSVLDSGCLWAAKSLSS